MTLPDQQQQQTIRKKPATTRGDVMKFTTETLDTQSQKYSAATGTTQDTTRNIAALITKEEAVKMLQEQDLAVYGDGRFPIEDYLHFLCKDSHITFADYLQAVSMAMGDPLDTVIRENFLKLDKDRSGSLDQQELGELLDECESVSQKKEQVLELLDCMDVDKDGKVNYAEIVRAICFD